MEERLENRYCFTKKVAEEAFRYLYFQSPPALSLWVAYALLAAANGALIVWSGQITIGNLLVFLIIACRVVASYWKYRRSVKLAASRNKEQYGTEEIPMHTILTDTGVQVFPPTGGEPVEIAYENLRYAARTRNLILFCTRAKLMHTMRRDSFICGTAEKCVARFKEKGVKVR